MGFGCGCGEIGGQPGAWEDGVGRGARPNCLLGLMMNGPTGHTCWNLPGGYARKRAPTVLLHTPLPGFPGTFLGVIVSAVLY